MLLTWLIVPAKQRQISTLSELTQMLVNGDLRLVSYPDAVYVKLAQNNESYAVLQAFLKAAAASDIVHAVNAKDAFLRMQNENLLFLWPEYDLRYRVTHGMFEPTFKKFRTGIRQAYAASAVVPVGSDTPVTTMCNMVAIEMDDYKGVQAIKFPFRKTPSTQIRRIFPKVIGERALEIMRIVDRYRGMPQPDKCQSGTDDDERKTTQSGAANSIPTICHFSWWGS